jgi:predicted methyltransferase MtxX (methanogen marker protein 4)
MMLNMVLKSIPTRQLEEKTFWSMLVKRTIARYVRGNIAAQNCRILLPDEQLKERESMLEVSRHWKTRFEKSLTKTA